MKRNFTLMGFFSMVALSIGLVTFLPSKTKADRVAKYSVWHNDPHNGHTICIPWPAVVSHLREHEGDVLLGRCDLADE